MPDLHDLETLVRATRPAPDPVWAARLDTRVARRFPDAMPPWYMWLYELLRANLVPVGALAGVATVVALIAVAHPQLASNDNASSSSGGGTRAPITATDSSGAAGSSAKEAAPAPGGGVA